jgi:preprotein translocase subunit YajC
MKIKKMISILSAAASTAAMAGYTALTAFAEGEAADAAASGSNSPAPGLGAGGMIFSLAIMFALLYFVAIRPQKKRDKELKEMQESLQVGDEVVTGGGIVGIVVSVGEDTVVIETGGAKHKLRIKNWAITENVTAAERIKEAKAAGKTSGSSSAKLESAALVDDDADDKKSKKKNDEEE